LQWLWFAVIVVAKAAFFSLTGPMYAEADEAPGMTQMVTKQVSAAFSAGL
jgi:hypothetical protein